jgi:hypothetical protein
LEGECEKGRTWWEGLLELVGLLGVLEDKGVEVALAADLELDHRGLLVALDACSYVMLVSALFLDSFAKYSRT